MRRHPIYNLEAALIADGVPMDKLYPLDVDRAFKKLEELKPHVLVWWDSGAQSAQILQDGEVDMVGAWNGRIQAAMKEPNDKGGPLAITFNQQMLVSDCWLIPKGAPNKDLAMKAIAIMMRPEVNARISLIHQLRAVQPGRVRNRRDLQGVGRAASQLTGEHQEGVRAERRLVGEELRRDGEALRRVRCRNKPCRVPGGGASCHFVRGGPGGVNST